VIGVPPELAGAVQFTVACELPAVGVPIVGVPGVVGVVDAADALDGVPLPTAFCAVTRQVYDVPSASPVTAVEVPATVPYDVQVVAADVLHSTR
jgi:hypothetical protein